MAQIDVKGTIYWESGMPVERSGRLEGAVITYASGTAHGTATTDDDGDFKIKGIDDGVDLSLVLLHKDAQSKSVEFKAGEFGEHLNLRMLPTGGRVSQIVGGVTLAALVVLLVVLVAIYSRAHESCARYAEAAHARLIDALISAPKTMEGIKGDELKNSLITIRDARHAVDRLRLPLDGDLAASLDAILAYEVAADAKDINDFVVMVDGAVTGLREPENRFLWTKWPWVLVEAWAWGLLGVLLTKIIRIGWYLRTSSYLARGTWMHLAHVVTTPFLALIAVLALSFIKLENQEQTIVDLANPVFLVITACLLSTNPWGLWDFVLGRGAALREKATTAS